jgi:hypothetical protein
VGETVFVARPVRIQYPGAVYHVMNCGTSQQKVFLDKQDYQAFLTSRSQTDAKFRDRVAASGRIKDLIPIFFEFS